MYLDLQLSDQAAAARKLPEERKGKEMKEKEKEMKKKHKPDNEAGLSHTSLESTNLGIMKTYSHVQIEFVFKFCLRRIGLGCLAIC